MTTPEAESFAELIADCADIPAALRISEHDLPKPRIEVSEAASRLAAALHLHLD